MELCGREIRCLGGWCFLARGVELAPLLPSDFPLTLSYTEMSFGYLEGYLIQPPFMDEETQAWRVEATCAMGSLTAFWSAVLSSLQSCFRGCICP